MELWAKRFLIAIPVSVMFVSFTLVLSLDDEISFLQFTPVWIVLLYGSFCFLTFFFFSILFLRKNEEYLRKVKKWDSPKAVGLYVILVWVVFGVFYYFDPKILFIFYALGFSIIYVSAAYLRNEYRKQLMEKIS
jgi:hypothetical protein